LLLEQTIMSNMAKGSDVRSADTRGADRRSRRKRGHRGDSNNDFVLAFADALRDILQDERRRAA
jgi:hypothetical protein